MKKNVLFVLFGAAILLTMNACKTDELDLDKELKFTKLSTEEQKAQIEQSGLDFVTAMEDMQKTKAMTSIMNMLEMQNSETYLVAYIAPLQKLSADVKNNRKNTISNFDKQMRVSYIDSEVWGEYVYNFDTKEMDKVKELSNKLIINFPATESSKTNNANITVTYEESTVEIPDTDGELYPSTMNFVMTVDGSEVMKANFSGKYYDDGSPEDVTQSLEMEDFKWTAEIKNDKKTASESYEFKKGSKIILKSKAEINGDFTEVAVTDVMGDVSPQDAISGFAIYFQVMDVAVKGGTKDFKKMMDEGNALDPDALTEKEYAEKSVEILNKYLVCFGYFVDDNRKFADVEFYVNETQYEDYDYSTYPYVTKTITKYEIAPRFVLSDGSKVAADEYVQEGFDSFINKLEDMENDFDF